ncbi:MAG: DUF2200 domain-containing protein [Aquiluna sp.]
MHRIFKIPFAEIYPLYVAKLERKGKSEAELKEIIAWLTGFNDEQLQELISTKATMAEFFQAANLNSGVERITGVICGVRVEEIEDPLMQKIRYLDKLVDELAKGKAIEKVLRQV